MILTASCTLAGNSDGEFKVSCAALTVIAPSVTGDEALRPFSLDPGTRVALLLSATEKTKSGIVQFDPVNSTISKFVDDKGNDLLTKVLPRPPRERMAPVGFGLTPTIKEGKHCLLEINSPNLPAKDATHLQLEGLVTLLTASAKKEHVEKNVALKKGSRITAGNIVLTIDNAGPPDIGAEPFSVTLRANTELNEVAEIKFIKADGAEIKSLLKGTSKMAILGAVTVDWTYNLAEKADTANVKLYIWSDIEKKRVPFSLKIDVGL